MSDLDPKAKASGSTPTVDGDAASATFWKKVIAFAINVKQGLDSLRGLNDPQDAAVTWRSLAQLGLVTTNGSGKKVWKGGVIRHGNVTIGLPSGQADSTTPPIPLNFAASAAIATSILSWTEPDYSNHSYTEVWRNTSNSLTGATMIGTSTSSVYADNVGVTSGVRYYWIRHISTAGIIGPYQSSSGTANTTAQIAAADITPLCITNALISNTAAIDSAKIASLAADKITAGTITSQTITLGNNSSSIIKSSNYSAGSAGWQIRGDGEAEFQNVTVRGTLNAGDISSGSLALIRLGMNGAFLNYVRQSSYTTSFNVEDATTETRTLSYGLGADQVFNSDVGISIASSTNTITVSSAIYSINVLVSLSVTLYNSSATARKRGSIKITYSYNGGADQDLPGSESFFLIEVGSSANPITMHSLMGRLTLYPNDTCLFKVAVTNSTPATDGLITVTDALAMTTCVPYKT